MESLARVHLSTDVRQVEHQLTAVAAGAATQES